MRTINFPNGQTLVSSALSRDDAERLFQLAVIPVLGIHPGTVTLATTAADSNELTVGTAGAIAPGQTIIGIGIPQGTTVTAINGTDVTMSAPAAATQSSMVAIGADAGAYYAVRTGWKQDGQPPWGIKEDVVAVLAAPVDDAYNRIRDVARTINPDGSILETTTYTRVWEMQFSHYGPNALDNARLVRSALFLDWLHDQLAAQSVYFIPDAGEPVSVPELFQGQWWERADFRARFNEFVTETLVQPAIETASITVEIADSLPAYGDDGYGNDPLGVGNTTAISLTVIA